MSKVMIDQICADQWAYLAIYLCLTLALIVYAVLHITDGKPERRYTVRKGVKL